MIFVSYRHEGTQVFVTDLHNRLSQKFGDSRVFVDFNGIQPGEAWPDRIREAVLGSQVLLAVIGKEWGNAKYASGKKAGRLRLDDPEDWVRKEICTAIQRGPKHIRVIVILVDDAELPETEWECELDQLRELQHTTIRSRGDFHRDFEELCVRLQELLPMSTSEPAIATRTTTNTKISLPKRLGGKIQDTTFGRQVPALFEYLENCEPPLFFPEITSLSTFINTRLHALDSLITDDALDVMSLEDVETAVKTILILALAFSIDPQEFFCLVDRGDDNSSSNIDWNAEWQSFLSEASRYDGRKLYQLLGSTEPIKAPQYDPRGTSLRDSIIVREFLRTRVAMLVESAALPSSHRFSQRLSEFFRPDQLELPVLVLRSLHVDVRHALDSIHLLSSRNEIREYKHVRITYIMCVFRVSLYLTVIPQNSISSSEQLRVERLAIPSSLELDMDRTNLLEVEMGVNSSTHDDPEALYVTTYPKFSRQYCAIRRLLDELQRDLDNAWAIIGEVYGRVIPLGLRIRRIRSNLDRIDQFSQKVGYVPRSVRFESAGVDLLKLLIGPLYGESPSVGIRELVQNAVDAIRERQHVEMKRPESLEIEMSDVVVSVNVHSSSSATVVIRDRGIGMTIDTIQNYFLKAGASYRRSDAWRESFELDGHSKILRSGRFGVGALAAFLLGPRITVLTRHFDSKPGEGLSFSCSVDDDQIEIRRTDCQVGTEITIEVVDTKVVSSLTEHPGPRGNFNHWEWYVLGEPRVERRLNDLILNQTFTIPNCHEKLPKEWRRISSPDFEDIQWSFNVRGLFCNGIAIATEPHRIPAWSLDRPVRVLNYTPPGVSVFDPDGNLSLNLQRSSVSRFGLPFVEKLAMSVCNNLIYQLCDFVIKNSQSRSLMQSIASLSLRGLKWQHVTTKEFFIGVVFDRHFLGLVEPEILAKYDSRSFLLLPISTTDCPDFRELVRLIEIPIIPVFGPNRANAELFRFLLGWQTEMMGDLHIALNRTGAVTYSNESYSRKLQVPKNSERRTVSSSTDSLEVCIVDHEPKESIDPELASMILSIAKTPVFAIWQLQPAMEKTQSIFAKTWDKVLGDSLIPFEPSESRKALDKLMRYDLHLAATSSDNDDTQIASVR